jgi:hypothetical protein
MVYIRFKTFQKNQLLFSQACILHFEPTIRYISYTGIMDTSPEMQIQQAAARLYSQEAVRGRVA